MEIIEKTYQLCVLLLSQHHNNILDRELEVLPSASRYLKAISFHTYHELDTHWSGYQAFRILRQKAKDDAISEQEYCDTLTEIMLKHGFTQLQIDAALAQDIKEL